MKRKSTIVLLICILSNIWSVSQKHDFKWLMGYSFIDNPFDSGFGCTMMDFNTADGNPILYEEKYKKIDFHFTSANISNELGNYLFAFNGGYVEGPNDQLMQNADMLNEFIKYPELGLPISQGALIIPYPDKANQFFLFHLADDIFPNYGLAVSELFYSVIDMTLNNNNGRMTQRKNSIIKDTLDDACLMGIKHANGRDWWVIVSEDTQASYYIFLVTKLGIKLHSKQNFSKLKARGESGQSFFSNNGKYFVTVVDDLLNHIYKIYFFNFDRCEGMLSAFQYNQWSNRNDFGIGCAFSPNDKFLYVATLDSLYKYDILNGSLNNVELIDSYDGYKEIHDTWAIPTQFGLMQTGPDGRIYNTSRKISFNAIHVINFPDKEGKSCNYIQHGIFSPTVKSCFPNMPKYRMGPIDGSVCDSLGIDNIPWAHWRYYQDTSDYLKFEFTDLSAYEVEQWCWDFGDPNSNSNTSMEKNPLHAFSGNGVYDVCLIVKNKNGADTLCRTIKIGNVVSTKQPKSDYININVWPNPCKDDLVINVIDYNPEKMVVHFYNQLGIKIKTEKLYQGSNFIDVHAMFPGIYFLSVFENGIEVKRESILKI